MAPATRTRKPLSARQQTCAIASTKPLILGKISKLAASASGAKSSISASQKRACQKAFVQQEEQKEADLQARAAAGQRSSIKRKRNQSQYDDEDGDGYEEQASFSRRQVTSTKKTKMQLLTPPHSQHNTDTESASSPVKKPKLSFRTTTTLAALPEAMQQLASLHSAFLKAFSLHEAHNGPSVPAEIGDLMFSTTRLWKVATVAQVDLQRMMAMYEVSDASLAPSAVFDLVKSPFMLIKSGLGFNLRTNVESRCVGHINASKLQCEYESKLVQIYDTLKSDPLSFVHCSQSAYPILAVRVGTQTHTQRQKAASIRSEILSKKPTSSELDLSKLSISDQMMDMTPTNVKSRTLSLFDRVRAKGVANSAASAPTAAQLTRRHAIGRIPEVVDYLRMKQSQKCSSSSILSLDDLEDDDNSGKAPSPSMSNRKSRAANSRRVSFSLTQIIREVRESVSVPVSAEEVSVVVTMLATEFPELGGWIRVFTKGCVVSVTLDGAGLAMSSREVGLLAERKEQNR